MKTSIDISDEIYNKIQAKGLKISYIFMKGWNSLNEPENVIELRLECNKLYENIRKMQEKIVEQAEIIENLKGGTH